MYAAVVEKGHWLSGDPMNLYIFLLIIVYLSTLQVLSMSRLGGAGAVAPLVTDIPLSSVEVIKMNMYVVFAGFLIIYSRALSRRFFSLHHRKREVMVEETNQHGRSGRTMGRNDRWLSLWKKT